MLEHKAVPVGGVEVLDEEQGIVRAIVSVTGIVDRVKDVIRPGAYTKTLKARTPKGIWHHKWELPISKTLEIRELMPGDAGLPSHLPDGRPWPKEAGALVVDTQFNLLGERGRQAFADVVFFGPEQEWSIGYRVPQGKSENRNGIRYCDEIDLFEYSPVLFGAMPAARTITSMKDAQETWAEIKGDIFGTCDDGEGTCCLSCGDKVAAETKDLHLHAGERWVVDFTTVGTPEGIPETVGTFGTKSLADSWVDTYKRLSPDDPTPAVRQLDEKAELRSRLTAALAAKLPADEPGEPDGEFERFYEGFYKALMEVVDDDALWVTEDVESKARSKWDEQLHRRGPTGRFIAKLGRQTAGAVMDIGRHRDDGYARRGFTDEDIRRQRANKSYGRWVDRAAKVEDKMAARQGRPPSKAAPRVIGALFAAHHLDRGPERDRWKNHENRVSGIGPDRKPVGVPVHPLAPIDLEADTLQMAEDWANGDQKRYARIMRVLPRAVDWLWNEDELGLRARLPVSLGNREATDTTGVDPSVVIPSPGPSFVNDMTELEADMARLRQEAAGLRGDAERIDEATRRFRRMAKSDEHDLELKRYRSGWDPDQPRDDMGRWTDTPGEAAMKQALQKMQKGGESAAEMLDRLKMDQGDADEVANAYFSRDVPPNPIDPSARRIMRGNPGDATLDVMNGQDKPIIDNAVTEGLAAQMFAVMAAKKAKLSDEADFDLQMLVAANTASAQFDNPDDRLQMATNFLSGDEIAAAYDNVMNDVVNGKRSSRKQQKAEVLAEALQVEMLSVYGQNWRKRFAGMKGPDESREQRQVEHIAFKKKVKRQQMAALGIYGAVIGAYVGFVGGMMMKADPAAPEGDEPPPELPPGPLLDSRGLNDLVMLPPAIDRDFHRFDVSTLTSPERALDPNEISAMATCLAVAIDDEPDPDEPEDEDAIDFQEAMTAAEEQGLIEPQPEVDENGEPIESEEEEDPAAEEKGWEIVDQTLDFYWPEERFLTTDGLMSKADDGDDDDFDIESFADDIIQDIFGDLDGDEPEEKRFDTSAHPRGPDGRFIAKPGAGGKIGRGFRSYSRALQYGNKLIPGRKKIARRRYEKVQKPLWRRERMVAKVQKRKPSRQLVKLEAAMAGAAVLAPDERREYLDDIGINLNDMRRNVARDFRMNGASPKIQERVERNMATLIDLWFRSEAGYQGPVDAKSFDVELAMADLEAKAAFLEELAIDEMIVDWDAEHVFDLMAKMSPEELEELIEGIESKGWDPREHPRDFTGKFRSIGDTFKDIVQDTAQSRPDAPGRGAPKITKATPKTLRNDPNNQWYARAGMVGWQPVESPIFDEVEHELPVRSTGAAQEIIALQAGDTDLDEELRRFNEGKSDESKAAPVSELTGGMVAEPGKGNKGNIKPIMRWFERGEGAAKIRWGTKGDFMRCVHLAEKHMNPEHARGFCNKRHVAVLGHPPGQGPHVGVPDKKSEPWDLERKVRDGDGDGLIEEGTPRERPAVIKVKPRERRNDPANQWYAYSGMTGFLPVESRVFDNVDHELDGFAVRKAKPRRPQHLVNADAERTIARLFNVVDSALIRRVLEEQDDDVLQAIVDLGAASEHEYDDPDYVWNLGGDAARVLRRRARKSGDDWDTETKCLLCTGDIGSDHICRGCGGDWGNKGTRRFLESMVRRASDGKFSNKPGGGGNTKPVVAGGWNAQEARKIPPKKKGPRGKAVGQRVGGKVGGVAGRAVGGVVGRAVANPKNAVRVAKVGGKVGLGAASNFASYRAGMARGKKANMPNVPGGGGGRGPGRGPSQSWVDTIDTLADMAADPDSLLNNMIDKHLVSRNPQTGNWEMNYRGPTINSVQTRFVGSFNASRIGKAMQAARSSHDLLSIEYGGDWTDGQPREIGPGNKTRALGPGQPELPASSMVFDLDSEEVEVTIDNETTRAPMAKADKHLSDRVQKYLDGRVGKQIGKEVDKRVREAKEREAQDQFDAAMRQAEAAGERTRAALEPVVEEDRKRADRAAKARDAGQAGEGPVKRVAQAVAKPLAKRDEKRRKAKADYAEFTDLMDRIKRDGQAARVKPARQKFEAAHAEVEKVLMDRNASLEDYSQALDRRIDALEELRAIEEDSRRVLASKSDGEDTEVLSADDLWLLRKAVESIDL